MPTPFEAVVKAIQEQLDTNLGQTVTDPARKLIVAHRIPRGKSRGKSWIAAINSGGAHSTDGIWQGGGVDNEDATARVKPLCQDLADVEIEISEETYEAAYETARSVLKATRETLGDKCRLGRYDVPSESETDGGYAGWHRRILYFVWDLVMNDDEQVYTTVNTITTSCDISS